MSKQTWTNEKISKEIKKVMNTLGIDRMPSRSEVEMVTKNTSLSNKISRTGGYYKWAEKLHLDVKKSESYTGIVKEIEVSDFIKNNLGWKTELTPIKFPYDILVGGIVKVDVKFSNLYEYPTGSYYSFNLEYTLPKSDVLVLICGKEKTLVIPSHELKSLNQISVGKESKYDKYKNNWSIIDKIHENFFNLGCEDYKNYIQGYRIGKPF